MTTTAWVTSGDLFDAVQEGGEVAGATVQEKKIAEALGLAGNLKDNLRCATDARSARGVSSFVNPGSVCLVNPQISDVIDAAADIPVKPSEPQLIVWSGACEFDSHGHCHSFRLPTAAPATGSLPGVRVTSDLVHFKYIFDLVDYRRFLPSGDPCPTVFIILVLAGCLTVELAMKIAKCATDAKFPNSFCIVYTTRTIYSDRFASLYQVFFFPSFVIRFSYSAAFHLFRAVGS